MSWRIRKAWQTDHHSLVLALDRPGAVDCGEDRGRAWLELGAGLDPPYWRQLRERPEKLPTELKSFAALFRKHVPTGRLLAFHPRGQDRGELGWALRVSGPSDDLRRGCWLLLEHEEGGDTWILNLIDGDRGVSLARMSPTKTFTKEKPFDCQRIGAWMMTGSRVDALLRSQAPGEKEGAETLEGGLPQGTSDSSTRERTALRRRLTRRLRTLRKSLARAEGHVATDQDLATLTKLAEWLACHLDQPKDSLQARVPDYDADLSPGANLDRLYRQIKRGRRSQALGSGRLAVLRQQIESLSAALEQIDQFAGSLATLEALVRPQDHDHGVAPSKVPPNKGHRSKLSHDVHIGRNASENDRLYRSAQASDYWFHAVALSGAHVWIESRKGQELSPQDLRRGAILALHYSKARQTRGGEVYVARRRDLRRHPSGEPGKLLVQGSARTLRVLYTAEELVQALAETDRSDTQLS